VENLLPDIKRVLSEDVRNDFVAEPSERSIAQSSLKGTS
jgi:hypothetical protein